MVLRSKLFAVHFPYFVLFCQDPLESQIDYFRVKFIEHENWCH